MQIAELILVVIIIKGIKQMPRYHGDMCIVDAGPNG